MYLRDFYFLQTAMKNNSNLNRDTPDFYQFILKLETQYVLHYKKWNTLISNSYFFRSQLSASEISAQRKQKWY